MSGWNVVCVLLLIATSHTRLLLSSATAAEVKATRAKLHEVPFDKVRIDDRFWSPRIETDQAAAGSKETGQLCFARGAQRPRFDCSGRLRDVSPWQERQHRSIAPPAFRPHQVRDAPQPVPASFVVLCYHRGRDYVSIFGERQARAHRRTY